MKKIEVLKELDTKYGLVNMFRIGVVTKMTIFHKDVFEKYHAFVIQGYEECEAKSLTSKYFKVTLRAVQMIVKEMK